MAAGEGIAVAGVPLCQAMNDRLLLCTSRPSVKVAWMTSIRGCLLFVKTKVACPALSVVPLLSWVGACGSATFEKVIATLRSATPCQSTAEAVRVMGPGILSVVVDGGSSLIRVAGKPGASVAGAASAAPPSTAINAG